MAFVDQKSLVEVRMILELIGHQGRLREPDGFGQELAIEVANADVPGFASLTCEVEARDLLSKRHASIRPVKQQQVDIVGAQPTETVVDRGGECLFGVVADPDLGREKHVGTV
jgi:hypothetical protein